ncbi:MAG: class I SAM-dependent methyltransferase [Candidatus Hodarchaeaceae archaeon]|nr:class I SAM-dependent methyltransferase [Candidatus Hodarchaeaceae archaeon]
MLRIYKEYPSEYQIQKYWSIFIKHNCNKILDAGCGVGWFGKFKPAQVELHGIDCNPEEVKTASKYEMSVIGDIRSLPYKNNFFDGIFCHHVLEHLENPHEAVREFFRVLKKGGVIIAEVPSKWDPNIRADPDHKQFFTKESLSDLFEKSRFKILSAQCCAFEIKRIKIKFLFDIFSQIGKTFAERVKRKRRAIRILCQK